MRTRLVDTNSPFINGILSGAGNAAKKLKSPASKSYEELRNIIPIKKLLLMNKSFINMYRPLIMRKE